MRYLTAADVQARFQISRSTLYRWQEDENVRFPTPVKIGHRILWREVELDTFDQMISDNRKTNPNHINAA